MEVRLIAIQRPYDLSIKGQTIDANENNTITWKVSGAIQSDYSVEIRTNLNNAIVYTLPKTASVSQTFILAANTLSNNVEYKFTITTYDSQNNSEASDPVIFSTSARPSVTIENIPVTIQAPWYKFTATYLQQNNVPIRSWIVFLYDSDQKLLKKSEIQTSSIIEYLFDNFISGNSYFIEFQATSAKGLTGTTGLVLFNILYSNPNINVSPNAENVINGGVHLTWDAKQIVGRTTGDTFYDSDKLNVKSGKVIFDQDYVIPDTFTAKFWLDNITDYGVSETTQAIISATLPTNINSLWFQDPNQLTPLVVDIISKSSQPLNTNALWFKNPHQVNELKILPEYSLSQPTDLTVLWIPSENDIENIYQIKLTGENGYLTLSYSSGSFHLHEYKDEMKEKVAEFAITGTKFCVSIQQHTDSYSLFAEQLI